MNASDAVYGPETGRRVSRTPDEPQGAQNDVQAPVCDVGTCRRPPTIAVTFVHGARYSREYLFCAYHDARAQGGREFRRGWQPWVIGSVRRL